MKTDNVKIKPDWRRSKEDIWAEKFAGLEETKQIPVLRLRRRNVWFYAAAAVVLIALLIPSAGYLYTTDITVARGEHLTVVLPDGSSAEVNADSRLSYKPYWWKVSRKVVLEGEAYFKVVRGSTFDVYSDNAAVRVLGTSFNVFARGARYRVTCLTGRVEVCKEGQSVVLAPDMKAVFSDNWFQVQQTDNAGESVGWTKNQFIFSGVPLAEVVEEIERQYDISVSSTGIKPDFYYSGRFPKTDDPEQVLQIIGRPFGVELKIR